MNCSARPSAPSPSMRSRSTNRAGTDLEGETNCKSPSPEPAIVSLVSAGRAERSFESKLCAEHTPPCTPSGGSVHGLQQSGASAVVDG
eukprot:5677841-Pleurochrysis_carterae.AAC.1